MASADARSTRTAALLLTVSAAALLLLLARAALLHHPPPRADLLRLPALMSQLLLHGGRCAGGVLDLATRRNMVLLCHAILILILRDAGVLGTPAAAARRRRAAAQEGGDCCSASARSVVVWRGARRNAPPLAPVHDAAAAHRLVVDRQVPATIRGPRPEPAATTWAAPTLETQAATKQMIRVEKKNPWDDYLLPADDDNSDRAALVPLDIIDEQPAAATSGAVDGTIGYCLDRRVAVVADHVTSAAAEAREEEETTAGTTMELADDRTFEEFIRRQRRKMRQESLRLLRSSSGCRQQAIATC